MRADLKALAPAFTLAACLAAAPVAAPAASGDQTYFNARYGYSVSYPAALFSAQGESANGDGQVFTARRGGAEFRVWANYAAQSLSVAQLAAQTEADCAHRPATYRVVKPNLIAISCVSSEGMLYEKQLIHGGLVTGFRMTYPVADRAYWDPMVTRIGGSLKAGKP